MPITTYTKPIGELDVQTLKKLLEDESYEFIEKPYTHFAAKKGKLNISVYQKGPKVLVQGTGTEDFVRFTLEPKVLGTAELGYEEVNNPEWFTPHIGVDESGKGDVLGPLVIAGAYTNKDIAQTLLDIGAMDSKAIKSRARIAELSQKIKKIPGLKWDIVTLAPIKYNELYGKFQNLNRLLAWGHATIIANLKEKQPDCPRALSDQFANAKVLEYAVRQKELDIQLQQRTKAESDPAVAAASILARDAFVSWMEQAGEEFGEKVPLGASSHVNNFIKKFPKKEHLNQIGKLHFKNFESYR